jgi:hypothetical protein
MGVNFIGLIAEWAPAVEAYRASGTDFYWDTDEDAELPFADEDYLGGFKRLMDLSNCYLKISPELSDEEREGIEPFLRLVGGFETERDRELDTSPVNDLLADAGGSPRPDEYIPFTMRPSTVRLALELAEYIPWKALEAACARTDFSDVAGNSWFLQGYDDLEWMLDIYLDWMKQAAALDRGLIVLVSM